MSLDDRNLFIYILARTLVKWIETFDKKMIMMIIYNMANTYNIHILKTKIQSTLIISTSVISNNCLSRGENLVPV